MESDLPLTMHPAVSGECNYGHRHLDRRGQPPVDGLVTVIVVLVVTFVWALSILIGFVVHDFQAALYTTPLMGAVVGYATGVRIWRNGTHA